MAEALPIILLSGMAADERLFEAQRSLFPQLRVPRWIEPQPSEPLPAYAKRLAQQVHPGSSCLVGGVSFGGMVALEMATHLPARGCLLISSVRSPSELPPWVRALRPTAALGPEAIGFLAGMASWCSAPLLPRRKIGQLQRLSVATSAFLRWASWAVLQWRPSAAVKRVRVWQVHGAADRTLPARYLRPDVVVPGAGHLLVLTHPHVISASIRRAVAWGA
jgi:pimeloyl-ACP methyl ester carboxylesterase